MSQKRFKSKTRHNRNLRAWQRKQSKLQTRKRTESTSAFDGKAFVAAVTDVCKRHGVAVCVCLGALPDNRLFSTPICLDTTSDREAKELHDICFGAVVEAKYTGFRVWHAGDVIEEVPTFKDKEGYLCVSLLMENCNWETKRLHELSAMISVPNPENKTRVRHKDGNKLNNKAENLEWC